MLPILEKEKGWENGVFTSIFFLLWPWSTNEKSINYSFFQFELMAEASINQVLNISKNLIIAFSNTVESKVALRRPWQDYRQTKHAMEQVRSNAVAGFLRRPRYTISLKLCHPLSLVIVGTCNSFPGAV